MINNVNFIQYYDKNDKEMFYTGQKIDGALLS